MSAPGFTMAAVAMMQIQQRVALDESDTNSPRLSAYQSPPSPNAFPRLKLAHRFKPLRRVLPSPYRTELLIAKGFYIDENQMVQKNPNSSFATVATQQKTTAFKAKSLSAPQGEILHAQPSGNSLAGFRFALDHLAATPVCTIQRPIMASTGIDSTKDLHTIASEQLSGTGLANIALKTGFASTTDSAAMSLGQASSAKVVDMTSTSPSGSTISVGSPLLEKELPQEPTLRCAESPERRGTYGTFTSTSKKLNGVTLRPNTSVVSSPASIGSDETNFDLDSSVDSSLYDSPEFRVATSIQIRKVSGTDLTLFHKSGQLTSEDTGSPQQVATPRNTARRLPTMGQVSDFKNINPVSKQLGKSKFSTAHDLNSQYGSFKRIEQLTTSAKQSLEISGDVFGVDDFARRSKNYGVGAKVRYANDAQNVIMGDKSGSESGKKLVGMSTNSMTSGIFSTGSFSNSEHETQIPRDTYPPRVSSLPASDNDVLYRLSRPTKASLARAQANTQMPLTKSGTMASVKKFLSRPSSMLAGRGRSGVSLDKSKGIGSIDKKSSTAANIACPINAINATCNDDEPPTLPTAGANYEGHCSEGGQQHDIYQQELQRELDRLRGIVATTTSFPGVYADFNQLSAQAQSIISSLTLMANQVDDQEARNRMWNVIRAVGESLALANANTSAIIAFSDANQRLLTATACLAESATAFAGRVSQTNANQY